MNKPDFFIIGAPKCGTTALSVYLSQHPEVCFAEPKEPHFFLTDVPGYRQIETLSDYQKCFNCNGLKTRKFGEGSTWYMYSKVAVSNILEFNKDAKIIAMLRDPVKMAESLYYQFVYGYEEDAPSFQDAWRLQESRLSGSNIPKNIDGPERLQYKQVCAVGTQLQRLMQIVPKYQLKIILFDDFVSDTKAVYDDVLKFLDLPADNREEFPRINESKTHRFKIIADFTQKPSERLDGMVRWLKGKLGINRIGLSNFLRKLNHKKNSREPMPDEFRKMLYSSFKDEITLVEKLLNRDLGSWHK